MSTIPYFSIDHVNATPVLNRVVGLTTTQLGAALPVQETTSTVNNSRARRVRLVGDSIYALHNGAIYRLDAPYTNVTAWVLVQTLPTNGTGGALLGFVHVGLFKVFVGGALKLVALGQDASSTGRVSFVIFDVATEAVDSSDTVFLGSSLPSTNLEGSAYVFNDQVFFTRCQTNVSDARIFVFNPTTQGASQVGSFTKSADTISANAAFLGVGAFTRWQGQLVFVENTNTNAAGANGNVQFQVFSAGSFNVVANFSRGLFSGAAGRGALFVDPITGNLLHFSWEVDSTLYSLFVTQITGSPGAPVLGNANLPIVPVALQGTANDTAQIHLIVTEDDTPGAAPATLANPQIDLIYFTNPTSGGILTRFLYADEGTLLSDQGTQAPGGDASIPSLAEIGGMGDEGFTVGQQIPEVLARLPVTDGLQISYRVFDTSAAVSPTVNVSLYRATFQDTVIDDDPNPQTRATIDNPSGAQAIVANEIQGVPADGTINTFRWRFFDEGFAIGNLFGVELRIDG